MAPPPRDADDAGMHNAPEARMPTLLNTWFRRHPVTAATAATPATIAETEPPEDDAPRGCGWFDSSHELQAGLQVTEHASPDAVAAALPLADWLGLHLGGWQPPAAAQLAPH